MNYCAAMDLQCLRNLCRKISSVRKARHPLLLTRFPFDYRTAKPWDQEHRPSLRLTLRPSGAY